MATKVLTVLRTRHGHDFNTDELDSHIAEGFEIKGVVPLGPNDFYAVVFRNDPRPVPEKTEEAEEAEDDGLTNL